MFKELYKEPPKTETQTQRQKTSNLRTRVGMEENSVIDLYILPNSGIIVYIRPLSEDSNDLWIPNQGRVSHIFRGISTGELREKFIECLSNLKPKAYKEIGVDMFRYVYPKIAEEKVYSSAERLNKTHYKNQNEKIQ